MNEQETFAYMLLSCSQSIRIHNEILADWSEESCSDILEIFCSLEGQSDIVDTIWPFDWEDSMDRIAPVQLTLSWDPRRYLLEIWQQAGHQVLYQVGNNGFPSYFPIIYLGIPPSQDTLAPLLSSVSVEGIINPVDKVRFDDVLIATVELAQTQNRGILFIGDWGFDYKIDAEYLNDEAIKNALIRNGMKFLTRHA